MTLCCATSVGEVWITTTYEATRAVKLASEAIPSIYRSSGRRFDPVRLVERDSNVAVMFAGRWGDGKRPSQTRDLRRHATKHQPFER